MSQRVFPQPVHAAARALAIGALALALPSAALAAPEQPDRAAPSAGAATVPGIIVEWEPGASSTDRVSGRDDADTTLVRTLGKPQFQLVTPQPGQTVADALAALRDDPAVRVAVRDSSYELHATTNDPLLGQLWGLQNLGLGIAGAPAIAGADADVLPAWDRTRGIPSVVVADLDTGYRFDHPDLGPVAWTNPADPANGVDDDRNGLVDDTHGADFIGTEADSPRADGDPTDDDLIDGGHGVHTAGTIGAAGNNGIGISGVAQDVRIMPLRVCAHSTVNDSVRCRTSSQIAAINYAGSHGARVANLSLGGRGPAAFDPTVRDAFASNPGVLFVISAGNDAEDNDGASTVHYPCAYDPRTSGLPGAIDNIVCVAALDQADQLASFSDWGATTVDLGAPGTDILSTFPQQQFLTEPFTVDDFASKWSATGAQGGFARTREAPLTSFGISDSPGATPDANSVHASTSAAIALPPGFGSCRITQTRTLSVGGGTYSYRLMLDGGEVGGSSGATRSGRFHLDLVRPALLAGGSLQLQFQYRAGPSPAPSDGVWLDDIGLSCIQAVGQSTHYDFLDGTSMAAPHVTGAAGLLFSLKPSASVAEVKGALLASAKPSAALAGRTTTGGRLDVAKALDALVPPTPPAPPAPPAGPPAARVAAVRCVVPRLAGLSLARAKTALSRAHCALGRVTKPRARRGRRLPALVVKSSKPGAGSSGAEGTRVALTLKAKPTARRRARRRRR